MTILQNNKLLFSDESKYRLMRHLLFWICYGLYFVVPMVLDPAFLQKNGRLPNITEKLIRLPIYLLPQSVLVYPLLYFILPRYVFTGKYIKALFSLVALLLLTLLACSFMLGMPWEKLIGIKWAATGNFKITQTSYLLALQASISAGALAASLKIYKYYYVKHLRNRQLLKENTEAQLQLLRAQVHPHFLFNTLNNIYTQTQSESPKGSKMIMGLSDMLRYILYEGQKKQVPLKQELVMITKYIQLEKIRYGNKLDMQALMPGYTDDLYIAPLLLLPFVENCFKHGASNMLQNPWINLTIELIDSRLVMKLTNGKMPERENGKTNTGIGIRNVRQRLELLYKGKYDLQIKAEAEVFVVELEVELISIGKSEGPTASSALKEIMYA